KSYILNATYAIPLESATLKVTGFGYLLEFEDAIGLSSQTYGIRAVGKKGIFSGSATYAQQSDYKDQPVDYDEPYYAAELNAKYQGFSAGLGYEVLSGDGTIGFSTPLATLHKFNGWADKFLATPADGLEDLYVKAGYTKKGVGPLDMVKVAVIYHDFEAEDSGDDYGSELDLLAVAKVGKVSFTAKYADYNEDGFATDTEKLWFSVGYKY
ncbi:MAG: hypothetical protein AAGH45_12460, partial [Pseudomonadota bacterium]